MDEREAAAKLPSPISVEIALSQKREDLRVPDRETLSVGPFTEHSRHFSIVEIREFSDLHHLGYVPKEISEQDAVDAVRADDAVYYRNLRDGAKAAACNCDEPHGEPRKIRRRDYQDHFWQLVQPLYREPVSFSDTAVVHAYGQVQSWLKRKARYYVGLSVLENIHIGKEATLRMTPSVSTVHANEVTIEGGGRFRFDGKKIHVKCNVLNAPNPFLEVAVHKYLSGFTNELAGG
jgi:hypothetical protein